MGYSEKHIKHNILHVANHNTSKSLFLIEQYTLLSSYVDGYTLE